MTGFQMLKQLCFSGITPLGFLEKYLGMSFLKGTPDLYPDVRCILFYILLSLVS